jgi:hypothetical protein
MALTRITTGTISANSISAEKMQNAAIQARHFQTGTITLDLIEANANVAAAEIRLNANLDIVQDNVASNRDSINIVQSNLVLAEANVVQVQQNLTSNINTVQTNVVIAEANIVQVQQNVTANLTNFASYANTNLDTKANVSATYFLALANDYASYTRLNSNLDVLQDNINSVIDGTSQFTGPVTMQDALTVQGNLIVVGAQVDLGVGSATVSDAVLTIAANTPVSEGLAVDSGVLINRGANDNVFFGFAAYGSHIDFIFTDAPAGNVNHYPIAYIDVHANSFGTDATHSATHTGLHHADYRDTGIYFPPGEESIEFSSGGSVVANVVSTGIIADSVTSGTVELRANDYATYTLLNANLDIIQDNVDTLTTTVDNFGTSSNANAAALALEDAGLQDRLTTNVGVAASNDFVTYTRLNANVNAVQSNLSTAHTDLSSNLNLVQDNVDAITGGGTFLAPFTNVNTASGTSNVFFVGKNVSAEANVTLVMIDGISQPNTEFVVNASNDTVQFKDATIPSGSIIQIFSMT